MVVGLGQELDFARVGEFFQQVEKLEQDEEAMERAVRLDVTLHAYMFMQSGIPVLYSGDEIGQVNDYSYKDDPDKAADSRYLHRGRMDWTLARQADDEKSVAGRVFRQLSRLETLRKSHKAFVTQADMRTVETGDVNVLCIARTYEGETVLGVFNFSEYDKEIALDGVEGEYADMITGEIVSTEKVMLPAYGFYYLGARKDL